MITVARNVKSGMFFRVFLLKHITFKLFNNLKLFKLFAFWLARWILFVRFVNTVFCMILLEINVKRYVEME